MAIIKPFKGFRVKKELARRVASRPYDVITSAEAREEAKDNPYSFLHVIKPEIDLPVDTDPYSSEVYEKGRENLENLIKKGILVQDTEPCFYIYAQTFESRTQYGILGCAHINDYINKNIKEHELTRPDKENDRINLIKHHNFHAEPVFFAYRDNAEINRIVDEIVKEDPEYNFVADDGIGHQLWVVSELETVSRIEEIFRKDVPYTYVADGHHRTAAAAKTALSRKQYNPGHTGEEEYNYFMAVHFPASQLKIIDYNRVIKDLNGNTPARFIEKLTESFDIEEKGEDEYKPSRLHELSMYIDGKWYSMTSREGTFNDNDPIDCLDVTILSKQVLDPILNITDLRKSKRIDFVGGVRGLGELKRRVDSGEMKAAFALYPVTMQQLINIADTKNIMPPKTTWFEPKLRSGLVLHHLG
ncbi:MAG: DUF1015 domain-containing protein [Bacteroidales bacterium]|nr:MAG: DUF1015 domain-containing protein [Bacteroidales bacterium]